MILRDIIQRVLSLYNKGLQSDDNRLKPRHVYNKLVTVRSLLLYQKSNKRQSISSWAYQTLPCVEMIKAPLHECPCIPPSGCITMRSKYPIPEIISDINSPMLNSVTNLDGDLIFSKSSWSEKKYKKGNRYTSNKPDYFFKDNYNNCVINPINLPFRHYEDNQYCLKRNHWKSRRKYHSKYSTRHRPFLLIPQILF